MSQICRTCLEEISDADYLRVNDRSSKIKDKLLACVPELDLKIIPNPCMCVYCANALHAAYDFKQKCLETEEKIRSHRGLDLVQIKQESEFNEKFDVVHGLGIGMEVIYIRDDGDSGDESFQNGQLKDDPVSSFLNCDDEPEWTPDMILGGFSGISQNYSIKSNSKAHSINKKKLKNIKKEPIKAEPKSTLYEPNNTNTRSKRLTNSFNGEKAFKCDLCTYTTPQETLLKLHVRTHSTDKSYHCPQCTYQTPSSHNLQNHLKSCNSLDLKSGLRERKLFKCKQCTFQTSKTEAFKEHLQVHLKKNFKCTKCSFEVSNLSTFKRHVRSHQVEKDDLLALSKHMSSHKNTSQKCNFCSYRSNHSVSLANHILTHTGERRFACTLCGYKAIQKGNLQNHMKFHTGKGPFKCSKCSYSPAGNVHLTSHMKKCH